MSSIEVPTLKTQRLILRPFSLEDADEVYRNFASDEQVTRFLAFDPPRNVSETRDTINTWCMYCSVPAYFHWAIELIPLGEVIGSLRGIVTEATSVASLDACIGRPWWNQGLMTEALAAVMPFFFNTLSISCLTACHHPDCPAAGHILRNFGFQPEGIRRRQGYSNQGVYDEICYSLLRSEYEQIQEDPDRALWETLYQKALSVLNPREISSCIEAGGVGAALYTASRHIYTGVCIDTACTLGMCAERNAIAHMITCGEQEILRIVAVGSHGQILSPCGACREMLMQLGPNARNIQVLLSREPWTVMTLQDLLPNWWN